MAWIDQFFYVVHSYVLLFREMYGVQILCIGGAKRSIPRSYFRISIHGDKRATPRRNYLNTTSLGNKARCRNSAKIRSYFVYPGVESGSPFPSDYDPTKMGPAQKCGSENKARKAETGIV